MERAGFKRAHAGADGTWPGRPVRYGWSVSARKSLGVRYEASDCPLCESPLFYAEQCCGRALSDAGPHEAYWQDVMPESNFAVACRTCEVAFFPLKSES